MQGDKYPVNGDECQDEKIPQSNSQYGTVADEEILGRFIYRNDWVDQYGKLTPAAISIQDLIEPKRKGVSVARLNHINEEELTNRISQIRLNSKSNYCGIARALTCEIRQIRTENRFRSICVVDDSTPDFSAHALLKREEKIKVTKSSLRQIRKLLLELFEVDTIMALGDL